MSLSGLVSNAVESLLADFVEAEDLKPIETGGLEWRNLKIRKNYILEAFHLPLDISQGILGRLSIVVPWNLFRSAESVELIIEDLNLCFAPYPGEKWSPELVRALEAHRRRKTIQQAVENLLAKEASYGDQAKTDLGIQGLFPAFLRRNIYSWVLTRLRVSLRWGQF